MFEPSTEVDQLYSNMPKDAALACLAHSFLNYAIEHDLTPQQLSDLFHEGIAHVMQTYPEKNSLRKAVMKVEPNDPLGHGGVVDDISLELRLKSINYIGNLLLKELQGLNDRRSVREAYDIGEQCIHTHGLLSGRPFWLASFRPSVGNLNFGAASDNSKAPMLIGVGEISQSGRPLRSVEWLQPLDLCPVDFGDADQISAPRNVSFPSIWVSFERKVRAQLDLSAIKERKFIDKIIKGSAQIVDCFTDENCNDRWEVLDVIERSSGPFGEHQFPSALYLVHDGANFRFEPRYMFASPSYSMQSIVNGRLSELGIIQDCSQSQTTVESNAQLHPSRRSGAESR